MHTSSDPGRRAPDPVPAKPIADPPRRALVVETYDPQYQIPAPASSVPSRRATRVARRDPVASRVAALLVAVGLHALLAAGLFLGSDGGPATPKPATPPLVLLAALPHAPVAREPIDVPPPQVEAVNAPLPVVPKIVQFATGPAEIAVSIAAATDVLISEANAREVEKVFDGCAALGSVAAPDRSREITLLVRVESDGHVSDSKIEVGSGTPRVDAAAQRCFLAHGELSPHRVNGAAIASWQRVKWSPGEIPAGKAARVM
jgi:hypothetical protein